ncbi:MAG: hypothetical protein EA408_03095 [Marinilabiliales bacterium]|nr:MAG: hypothetical protein EA408_03095 [Marinilabiliales bacterium]
MRRLSVHKVLLFCPMILFLITTAVASDMQLNFFSLTRADGLSNNSVTAIVRDEQGYIWFGTQSGLNRYNGYEFRQYYHDQGDSTSLPANRITALVAGNDGNLWAGCHSSGLARYDRKTDRFLRYRFSDFTDEAPTDHIVDMEYDRMGRLWVATHGGLFLYDSGKDRFLQIKSYGSAGMEYGTEIKVEGLFTLTHEITSLTADDRGNIWVAHPDWSLSYINAENRISGFYNYLKEEFGEMPESLIQLVYHDKQLYFAGGHRGLYAFDPAIGELYTLVDPEILRSPLYVTGHKETVWVSSLEGLFRYDTGTGNFAFYSQEPTNPKSITTGTPGVLFVDESEILWLAAGNLGINYSLLNMPFMNLYEHAEFDEFLFHPNVTSMLHDSRGNFWVAFQSGVVQAYFNGSPNREIIQVDQLVPGTGIGYVFGLFEASDGTIFMTSWRGGLQFYDPELKKFVNIYDAHWTFYENFGGFDVRDVTEGPDGSLYLAVFGSGVVKYDRETNRFLRYVADPEKEGALANSYVYDLEFDRDDNLWVSTTWGLNKLPAGDSLFTWYLASQETGTLLDNYIRMSFADRHGRMWFVTNGGLNLYDPVNDSFANLHVDELGYTTLVISSVEEDEQGHLWLSTSHGIINVRIYYTEEYSPAIEEVFVYDISHGLLSDDFFGGSSSVNSAGLLFFGGNRGIDYFDPASISPVEDEGDIRIESIRIFDRLVYPGSDYGPPLNENGEILLSHAENMIGIQYAMLNFIDSPKNKYFYMLEPLHGDWIYAGADRHATFANLPPGSYTFRVRSCPSDRLCDSNEAVLGFFIKPPFWKTWPFYVIAGSVFLLFIYLIYLTRTRRLRETKAELERLVELRTQELGRQASKLRKANEQLGELNSMKDKFFSIIAHDLRSPLSSIAGFSELLITSWDGYDDAKRKSLIEIVSEATRNTIIMLDNLLQWANSQTGRLSVKAEKVVPADVVNDIHVLYRKILEEKDIRFSNRVPGDLRIISDLQLLSVVFRNLISNAHKFTPPGGNVIVSATLNDDETVCFDVTDTGGGFPEDLQQNIFRIDKSWVMPGTDGKKGGGLGLILCHEFVTRLGGKIWVRETSEKGTTISFTLP